MSSKKKVPQKEPPSFESTMKSVEKLLEKLEGTDVPLEESLGAFEEGISLVRLAQQQLSDAEQRVQVLLEQKGVPVAVDIELDESDE